MLPAMRTDIHLKKETEHVIVDTKFYREALQTYHGKSSIHSEHLYQLFSYLKNAAALGDERLWVAGGGHPPPAPTDTLKRCVKVGRSAAHVF